MEEGYLRPDYVTLEQGGVNAFSPLYAKRDKLVELTWPEPYHAQLQVGKTFARRAWYASRYHINKSLFRWRYPHFVNHRPWSLSQEASGWVAGGLVKWRYRRADRRLLKALPAHKGHIFFVPLQVTEDFQIREHSDLSGVEEMVAQVMNSFAEHARHEDVLLFKHHPMDRVMSATSPRSTGWSPCSGWKGECFMAMTCRCRHSVSPAQRGHHHQQHGWSLRPAARCADLLHGACSL